MSALVQTLLERFGAARVSVADDERIAQHVSGQSIGRPACVARPDDAAQCAEMVALARDARARVVPIGDGTTFWDAIDTRGAVVIDTRALLRPLVIDVERRLARAGAGVSVREIDRAARRHGLCLAAAPDGAGDTPIGALLAVGSTAGLGMGRCLPVESVTGALLVDGRGRLVSLGAGLRLGGRPFVAEGIPDLLGLIVAAEGRAAIVAEVGLALQPAPHSCAAVLTGPLDATGLLAALAEGRASMDRQRLETFRIELLADRGRAPSSEIYLRAISPDGVADAEAEARRVVDRLGPGAARIARESEASRAGVEPDYSGRWSFPAGEHRARLAGHALWGVEVNVSWGDDARRCLDELLALYEACSRLAPVHRRLGLYAGRHLLSFGVQLLVERAPDAVAHAKALLSSVMPALLAAGAVPYRAGRFWAPALAAHLAARDEHAGELVEAAFAALDPDGVIDPRRS